MNKFNKSVIIKFETVAKINGENIVVDQFSNIAFVSFKEGEEEKEMKGVAEYAESIVKQAHCTSPLAKLVVDKDPENYIMTFQMYDLPEEFNQQLIVALIENKQQTWLLIQNEIDTLRNRIKSINDFKPTDLVPYTDEQVEAKKRSLETKALAISIDQTGIIFDTINLGLTDDWNKAIDSADISFVPKITEEHFEAYDKAMKEGEQLEKITDALNEVETTSKEIKEFVEGLSKAIEESKEDLKKIEVEEVSDNIRKVNFGK